MQLNAVGDFVTRNHQSKNKVTMENENFNIEEAANSDLGAVSGILPDEVPNLFVTLAQQIHHESVINGLDMTSIIECFNELQEAYKKERSNNRQRSGVCGSVYLTEEEKELIYQKERKKYEGSSWEVELDYHKETFMSGIDSLIDFLNNR